MIINYLADIVNFDITFTNFTNILIRLKKQTALCYTYLGDYMTVEIKPIAYIYNDYVHKFGVPRQSGIADTLVSKIIFTAEYRDVNSLRGMEGFSHLWLIWHFSLSEKKGRWSPTVRPPRLGGNKRIGVFATRSPNRPNPLGLSAVKLIKIEENSLDGPVLYVTGADLVNGTPIFDIKPYLPFADSIENAKGGYTDDTSKYSVKVECSDELIKIIPQEKRDTLLEILKNDPRPAYQNDPERIYRFDFAEYDVHFCVKEDILTVINIFCKKP